MCRIIASRLGCAVAVSVVVCLAITSCACADMLQVDFGATSQRVLDGFLEFSQTTNPGTTSETETFTCSLGLGGTVDVTVSVDSGYSLGFRDRGTGSGTLAQLIEDHVKPNGSTTGSAESLYLDVLGLKAGTYEITTYHHDRSGNVGEINILLDDANGAGHTIVSNLQQTWSTQTPAEVTFSLTADGVNPVRITFEEVAGSYGVLEAVLNGFILQVPEPGGVVLCLWGCLAMLAVVRRRTRGPRRFGK